MDYLGNMKKIIFVLIAILAYVVFELDDEWINEKRYAFGASAHIYFKNTFNQSKFETDNFIIDLPKAHWLSYKNSAYRYHGIPVRFSNGAMFPYVYIWKYDNEEEAKKSEFSVNEKLCKTFEQQPNKKINNFEVEVYDCADEEDDLWLRVYFYKNEVFHLIYYHIENFRHQFDKFFEGVWLKE